MRILARSVVAGLGLLSGAGPAWAHAYLAAATPAPGSTVPAAPSTVSIEFTEPVEPQSSTITVQDDDEHSVTAGPLAATPGNNRRLSIGLAALAAGTYRVIWHATAQDADKTQGTYQFMVRP